MKSITLKLMISVSLLFLTLILLIFCANLFFLDDYYRIRTKSLFEEELSYFSELFKDHDQNKLNALRSRAADTGMRYIISDRRGDVRLNSSPEFRSGSVSRLPNKMIRIIPVTGKDIFYGIIQRENTLKEDLVLSASLPGGEVLFITYPLEHLKKNARISNQFLLIIGTLVFLISLFLSAFFARTVVRPVKELTEFSGRIARLDFSERYDAGRDDEIGRLGTSLNKTAGVLEQTIGDLKNEMVLQKRFLASVSHELKSPIALIRGYSEALNIARTKGSSETEAYTEIIVAESDRLNLLVNDLLLLLKLDSVDFKLLKTEFDLTGMVEGIITKNRQLYENRSHPFHFNHPGETRVLGDEKRLVQAVENILNNAVKHSPVQSPITVNLKDRGQDVLLEIMNEGAQIPEVHLDHLFDPFYSAESSRDRNTTGSGLGLSIVKSIIEKHSGFCTVENIGKGVCVSFSIPKSFSE